MNHHHVAHRAGSIQSSRQLAGLSSRRLIAVQASRLTKAHHQTGRQTARQHHRPARSKPCSHRWRPRMSSALVGWIRRTSGPSAYFLLKKAESVSASSRRSAPKPAWKLHLAPGQAMTSAAMAPRSRSSSERCMTTPPTAQIASNGCSCAPTATSPTSH